MTTFPFDRRKPIIVDPAAPEPPLPGLPSFDPVRSTAILFQPGGLQPDGFESCGLESPEWYVPAWYGRDANRFDLPGRDPSAPGHRGPADSILFYHPMPLLALPTQPVGDPVPRPSTPQPTPQREPEDPVRAPHPREPELPAIDPHEPGLPDTRIGRFDGSSVGDPPSSSRRQWLV